MKEIQFLCLDACISLYKNKIKRKTTSNNDTFSENVLQKEFKMQAYKTIYKY